MKGLRQFTAISWKIFPLLLLSLACNEEKAANSDDPAKVADEHNEAKFSRPKEKDAEFMVDAAVFSLNQVELAGLVQKQSVSKEVKKMAAEIEKDHKEALKELRKLAESKTITLPDSVKREKDDDYSKIMSRSGEDFDKEFCKRVTEDHKDAISKYEKASTDAEDYEIKNYAGNKLSGLRKHLDEAMSCREKMK